MTLKPTTPISGESSPAANGGGTSQFKVLVRTLAAAFGLAVLLGLLGYLFDGRAGLEKTLTKLGMPIGALWLFAWGVCLQSLASGSMRSAMTSGLLCAVFSIVACSPAVELCVRALETQVVSYDPQADPHLDVLVVLGGGAKQGPARAEVGAAGDRVLYAAQLFIQGHVGQLITTGEATKGYGGMRVGPSQLTIEIWTQLGIPRDKIATLGGKNTYEELQSLKALLPSELKGKRVGLLTSAMHLPRAMRLAQAQGLSSLVPVAADHQWSDQPKTFAEYLPNADALAQLARCQHEFMAMLIKR